MTLWLIDANQKRHRLIDRSFTPRFHAHGPEPRLKRLAQALAANGTAGGITAQFTERINIWDGRPLRVLEIAVRQPPRFSAVVQYARHADPGLRFYNSDLMLPPLYCWEKRVFPLARVEVEVSQPAEGAGPAPAAWETRPRLTIAPTTPAWEVRAIECQDDEWSADYELPPLTVMSVRLEGLASVNPNHGRHGALEVAAGDLDGLSRPGSSGSKTWVLDDSEEPVAVGFERLLRAHDPDLIVSEWGDSILFPRLLAAAQSRRFQLSLNRGASPVEHRRARSYMSYGRILFKESTTTLFGRLHVDTRNSFIAGQCELDGLWELARITKLPVQYAARTSTGTGISYMQMELAWRDGVLIPQQKAEPETPKQPDELLLADRGGLVFTPRLGFFANVAELDFVSEYPSIMARFNVSPETVNCACCPDAPRVPELGYRICQRRRGITSRVVERLIEKRQIYKCRITASAVAAAGDAGTIRQDAADLAATASENGAGRAAQCRSALKWLLVCCFGYTGYKNARFGKIEAHEAINALAREKLLVAKETAEAQGFRVLHALVDSLYVQREDATPQDYTSLAGEIEQTTGLPLAVEAVYRYAVFLPSKQSAEVPVPNRFFCVAENGEMKIRGLECRRHDTPPIVERMQRQALAILAEAHDFESYCKKLEEAREVLNRCLDRLRSSQVSVEELIISRRLTRAPSQYKQNNSTAIVARQLARAGVELRPGECIQYIITAADGAYPDERFRAFTFWEGWHGCDVAEYERALRKAFEPLEQFAWCCRDGLGRNTQLTRNGIQLASLFRTQVGGIRR